MVHHHRAWNAILAAFLVIAAGNFMASPLTVLADTSAQTLPFTQDWSNADLITTDNEWSGVSGIVGYAGNGLVSSSNVNPQTILADGTGTHINVKANRSDPDSFSTYGVTEFDGIANPAIGLAGATGSADAPFILISLDTSGFENIRVQYNVRDLDASNRNTTQQVALHYRVGATGNFTNIPGGYIADATSQDSATQVFSIDEVLPANADDQSLVQVRILTSNANGTDEWVGIDNISITGDEIIYDDAPSVSATTPDEDSQNVATGAPLTVTFSEPVTLAAGWFTLTCDSTDIDAAYSGSDSSYTITPSSSLPTGAACTLTVLAEGVTDVDDDDPPDHLAADFTLDFTTTPCGANYTAINQVQGSGTASLQTGKSPTLEGIVTARFDGDDQLGGFFLQSLAEDEDTDEATSEGIFIYTGANPPYTFSVGDEVRIAGQVKEYDSSASAFGQMDHMTELVMTPTDEHSLLVCSSGHSVAAKSISLPLPDDPNTFLERYEGMLVTFTGGEDGLYVQQNAYQGRFGQLTVAVAGLYARVFNPNNVSDSATAAENLQRIFVLDDGSNLQNPTLVPYYDMANPLRAGDHIEPVTGVLDQGKVSSTSVSSADFVDGYPDIFYRLHPTAAPLFTPASARADLATPPDVGGELKVAGFNLHNFFTSLDDGSAPTPPYNSGATPRGADTAAERERQLQKLVTAISALDADVLGLVEVEAWEEAAALPALVDALNDHAGALVYTAISYPDGFPQPPEDGDFIKVALIYKHTSVTALGSARIDPDPLNSRVPLAQTFRSKADGEIFSVIVNHFKSKSDCPNLTDDPLNVDLGQGCWNALRTQQAAQLSHFVDAVVAASGDPDVLVIGDLNAYGGEDPLATLTGYGLVDQLARFVPAESRYSYIFDGQAGYLDHALATANLSDQVSGAAFWHINADEPAFIDFDQDYNPAGYFDSESPFRASDHDPTLAGLTLQSTAPSLSVQPPTLSAGRLEFALEVNNPPDGSAIPEAFYTLKFTATSLAEVMAVEFYDPATSAWTPVGLEASEENVIASIDPECAGLFPANHNVTARFRVTLAHPASYNISFYLSNSSLAGGPVLSEVTASAKEDEFLVFLPVVIY